MLGQNTASKFSITFKKNYFQYLQNLNNGLSDKQDDVDCSKEIFNYLVLFLTGKIRRSFIFIQPNLINFFFNQKIRFVV